MVSKPFVVAYYTLGASLISDILTYCLWFSIGSCKYLLFQYVLSFRRRKSPIPILCFQYVLSFGQIVRWWT
jgi:hypothetical protein